ncbi:MAG: thioredoxin [Thiohalomonadaceae bacterium]
MTRSHILDVTIENFSSAVIEQSRRVPVLVDFWASWCGPCRMLLPVVSRLAEEYAGLFVLAKVNIDEQPELATRFGVRSVPTVKLVRNGQVVDEFLGAQPESAVRAFLDRHIERESDKAAAEAQALLAAGRVEEATRMLEGALAAEPASSKLLVALADAVLRAGDSARARVLLEQLPAGARDDEAVANVEARLEFADRAAEVPPAEVLAARLQANPNDGEARHQLATRQVMAGDHEAALENLLELLKRDRAYRDAARTDMLKVFTILGTSEVASRYRGLMFNALH